MNLGSDISLFNSSSICDCYKKLQTYGIPLLKSGEDNLYSEHQQIISYENAFELPGFLEIVQDITEYPVVDGNDMSFVFQQMAEVIPKLSDFEQNVLSFWILDMIIEGLWTAQNSKMNFEHQRATLLWIIYFYNYIQKFNPTRNELFKHLKVILFQCGNKTSKDTDKDEEVDSNPSRFGEISFVSKKTKTEDFPLPPELFKCNETSQNRETSSEPLSKNNSAVTEPRDDEKSSRPSISDSINNESTAETNLTSMKIILDVLYRIFGRLWAYLEIQTVFHSMPPIEQVDLPFTLTAPKPLLKLRPPTPIKTEKGIKKSILSEMPLEQTESERQLHKNDYILPLQIAEEAKFYMKQFIPQSAGQRSSLGKNKEDKIKKL